MKRLLLCLLLACGESTPDTGSVCPACVPEVGGESGDLGGSTTLCTVVSLPEAVDAAKASALGFDVAELERRVSRSIDLPLAWTVSEAMGGGPASGYSSPTRVTATLRGSRQYRHVRPDPRFCDGTTCAVGVSMIEQAFCPRLLETDVEATVATADGAIEATLAGTAWTAIAGNTGQGSSFVNNVVFTTRVKLSEVHGTLRVAPDRGASSYHTFLQFQGWLRPDSTEGEITPNVLLETNGSFTHYGPLLGSFPPSTITGIPNGDAGAPR